MNNKLTFFAQRKTFGANLNRLVIFFLLASLFLYSERALAQVEKKDIQVIAQTGSINGQVMDEAGIPLIGVTVLVKNKNIGVLTDESGLFSIKADYGEILQFRMITMETVEVTVEKGKSIKVVMKADAETLEEVVVVGYGKQKKVTITGSVSSVNMRDMEAPVPSLSNALQGKVAGIIAVQGSGEPGYDNSTFTIRGISSFTGNTSPLIIIDGVQRDDVNSTYGGAFNNIDPEDIESISLLKDASATAVYGAKGANGVLIIDTKRGVAGKPKISVKMETGFSGFTKRPKMLDGVSYMELFNEGRRNAGQSETYSRETILKTASGLDPYLYPNVNWIDEVYKENSAVSNVNLNISGGGESMRYFLSTSYYDQEGPYNVKKANGFDPNLAFKRYDFRSNIDVNLTPTTLLQMNLSAMLVDSKYPGVSASDLWYMAYGSSPIAFPTQYPDGRWAGPNANAGANPLNEVQNNGYTKEFKTSIQSVFTLKQDLKFVTEGLSAYGRFSFDSYSQFDNKRRGGVDLWRSTGRDGDGNLIFGSPVKTGTEFLNYKKESNGERVIYFEGNVAYDRAFDVHRIGGMLLFNMRNRMVASADEAILSLPYRNQAVAGRASYAYDDRYLVEFNASYTGSENFASGQRFGFFPAASLGWIISSEKFFEPMYKYVNLFKLRGSYGVVGNDNITRSDNSIVRFAYLSQIGKGNSTGLGETGVVVDGIKTSLYGVEGLTWEKSYKTNIGLEMGFIKKIDLSLDFFWENREQILIPRASLPGMAGFGADIYSNMGKMDNTGFDAHLEYTDKLGNVGVRFFGNVTYSKNKIVNMDEPVKKYAYQSQTGTRFGEYYGYVAQGLFVDRDDIDGHAPQFGVAMRPGDIKYMNLNPSDDTQIDAYDQTYLRKSWFPTWSYGGGANFYYKNFDLGLFFQGVADVGIMANGSGVKEGNRGAAGVGIVPFTGMGQYPNNALDIVKDRWTEENPRQDAFYPRLSYNNKTTDSNFQNSTRWLKDGSYLRLKQASIGYKLQAESFKKIGLSHLYFYVTGQNLLTFSKFKLWDPELGSDAAKYPLMRTITFGMRVEF